VKQVEATRKKIARIKTLMRQRELVAAGGEA
jgi:ribosomal protein L29